MRMTQANLIWMALVLLAVLGIYLPSLGNVPAYDDRLLTSGDLFSQYSTLLPLKPRLFSYGSFVWLQDMFGTGWWKQRLVNLAIHIGVILALWGFYREILRFVAPSEIADSREPVASFHESPALGLAIGFFALNPVAVYAVAYLIQRSILMATLFVVLALFFFALGLAHKQTGYYLLSLLCYVLAVASKEHAVMAPLAAVPVYILIVRPSGRQLTLIAAIGGGLVAIMGALLALKYGDIIGQPFDQYSKIYLQQLAPLGPDVQKNAYPLSIINQAYFFFAYVLHWLLPYAGWMSIDMRPPFPVKLASFPQVLGIIGYLAVVIGGVYLVIRHRDWRALVGLSLLLPATLFVTEFSTVWVQDPFVLYRSYLWAIGLPGLVFFLFHGTSPRVLLAIGLVLGGLFVWQALDRVYSLSTTERIWTDTIEKLPDDPRSVGRWFPFINRAEVYLDQNRYEEAYRDFQTASQLGDQGMGTYNIGALFYLVGKSQDSLAALDAAEKQGYDLFNLDYQRGVALFGLGKTTEAISALAISLSKNPPSPMRERIMSVKGQMELKAGNVDAAIQDFSAALQVAPKMADASLQLAMAYLAKRDYGKAVPIFTRLLAESENSPAYYGRAVANFGLNRKVDALSDIENAIRLDPNNPALGEWQTKIRAMP